MTTPQTPDDARRALLEQMGPAMEGWQVILDLAEGMVSRTKQMGWSDEQARNIVLPQVIQIVASIGQPPSP